MLLSEQMLKEEIEFWRSMIKNKDEDATEQAVERMCYALDLAEQRLLLLSDDQHTIN